MSRHAHLLAQGRQQGAVGGELARCDLHVELRRLAGAAHALDQPQVFLVIPDDALHRLDLRSRRGDGERLRHRVASEHKIGGVELVFLKLRHSFLLLDAAPADAGPPGLELSLVAAGDRAPKFDLTLWAEVRREELRLSLTYDEDLFDAAAAAGMLDRLGILLARVAEDPGQPLLDVPLAAADEEPPAITPPPAFVERFAFEA